MAWAEAGVQLSSLGKMGLLTSTFGLNPQPYPAVASLWPELGIWVHRMQPVTSLGGWDMPPRTVARPQQLLRLALLRRVLSGITHVFFPCSGRRCRPTAPPARRLGPPRARCHSSCRSTASSRVSLSPKRCQAKAGGSWDEGSWPGSLCSLSRAVRAGQMGVLPPGTLASTSASLQTQRPALNKGSCRGPTVSVVGAAVRMKRGSCGRHLTLSRR